MSDLWYVPNELLDSVWNLNWLAFFRVFLHFVSGFGYKPHAWQLGQNVSGDNIWISSIISRVVDVFRRMINNEMLAISWGHMLTMLADSNMNVDDFSWLPQVTPANDTCKWHPTSDTLHLTSWSTFSQSWNRPTFLFIALLLTPLVQFMHHSLVPSVAPLPLFSPVSVLHTVLLSPVLVFVPPVSPDQTCWSRTLFQSLWPVLSPFMVWLSLYWFPMV